MLSALAVIVKILHFIVCIGLIVVVLLQADKGEGLAGAFGGGASTTLFGDRGDGGVISKITSGMAIVFMFTSLLLAVWVPGWTEQGNAGKGGVSLSTQPAPTSMPAMPVPGLPTGVPTGAPAPAPAQGEAPAPGGR